MAERTTIARWESQGGTYWAELYHDDYGYCYRGKNSGGNMGPEITSDADAIAWMEARTASFPTSRTGNYFHPGKRPMRRVEGAC